MTTARVMALVAVALALWGADARAGQRPRPEPIRIDPLTASISGRVTTDTGGPLRRAEIRAISEIGLTRFATTDTDGRYLVRDLPAGTFTLHVSKSGFVPLYFGQRRPFEARGTIRLAEGQRLSADVRLPRAGAITGRIVDRTGEPVMGARVQALRRRMVQGQRGLQASGVADTTDDTGAYRLYGLAPGEYYVTATPRRVEDRVGRLIGEAVPGRGAPIFYPGTANRDEAQRVTVDVSGEARADMQFLDVPTSRVSGIVLASDGTPAAGAMITLLSRDLDFAGGVGDGMQVPLQIQDDAAADGSFELTGVPPGSFTLRAQTRPNFSAILDISNQRVVGPLVTPVMESAFVPVVVGGDIAGLTVTTVRGGTVDVTVVADQGVTAPLPRGVRVSVRMDRASETMTMRDGSSPVKMVLSLAASSRVAVEGLPENWALKAILLDNEDVTDTPIDVRNGRQSTLKVVLTDRVTDVVGTIASSSIADTGTRVQATVIVFADDETKWSYPSRFVRSVRAGEKGTFQMTGLPGNADYRAIAVDYLEDGEETDPEFLKRIRERATRFSLSDGERRAIDLRLIQR